MFVGSVPLNYETQMGPIIFEPFAVEFAKRVEPIRIGLELACGTGRLTRHLRPKCERLIATDISPEMIAVARKVLPGRYELADATELPYESDTFDLVACQFGVMFFPNRERAFHEVRRVLTAQGRFLFTTWGSPTTNPWALVVGASFERVFGEQPDTGPGAFRYFEPEIIERELRDAGFRTQLSMIRLPLVAKSSETYARATVTGTPMAQRLRLAGASNVEPFIAILAEDLRKKFGDLPMETEMNAIFVEATLI